MAEYDFIAGPRKGKVWKEKYYLRNKKNFIQEAKKYIPINSQWLTKEEFKNYILSLLDKGIPQIYVVEELPEDLFPYALIFVQNEGKTSIYVDKEGIRTEINIGDGNYDAVNVVENLPQNLQNNVIYYSENKIDEQKLLEKGLNLDEQKSYIYVYEDEEIKQVIPNVDYIAEEQMVLKNKTINGEDNTIQNLKPEDSIKPGYIINKIEESKQYYGFNSFEDPNDIIFIDDNSLMALVYVYKAKVEGGMITEIISKSTDKVYNYGAFITYEEKDYYRALELDQVYPILDKSIVYTQTIKTYVDDKTQPISDLTTKSLKNVYNNTLGVNKLVCTDGNGIMTTVDPYTVQYPLTITGHQIGLGRLHNSASGTFVWNFSFDEYGRVYSASPIDRMLILGRILVDKGSVTIDLPSSNMAIFFLNTHAGNFCLAQINANPDIAFRKVQKILWNNNDYHLPLVQVVTETRITITASGNCRAVIFTFDTKVT